MPKDKTLTHIKIVQAAKAEFLEKGFEKASMREIGKKAGMTSAGLYRHYESKEDMFNDLVQPAIVEFHKWYKNHKSVSYKLVDINADKDALYAYTAIDFFRDVINDYKDEFRLLLLCSQGTKYENFIHDIVRIEQKDFADALIYMKSKGMNVRILSDEEMHLIMSAYTTALFEPFVHNMTKEQTENCLNTIEEFFMPGWQKIMGF